MRFLIPAVMALAAPAVATAQAAPQTDTDATFNAMDGNKDGQVSKAEYRSYIQARFSQQARAMDAAFVEMDKDKDGQITKVEASVVPVIASAFDALDTDRNGSLSKAEMQEALSKAQAVRGAD